LSGFPFPFARFHIPFGNPACVCIRPIGRPNSGRRGCRMLWKRRRPIQNKTVWTYFSPDPVPSLAANAVKFGRELPFHTAFSCLFPYFSPPSTIFSETNLFYHS